MGPVNEDLVLGLSFYHAPIDSLLVIFSRSCVIQSDHAFRSQELPAHSGRVRGTGKDS